MSSISSNIDYYTDRQTRGRVESEINEYLGFFDPSSGGDVSKRRAGYETMVNRYYDLVTDFYEYGWGQSFHFAPRHAGETFNESLVRAEHFLALKLGLQAEHHVLDVGCGVGGPMRNIAHFSGASIDGVNNNAYQLEKLAKHNARAGLSSRCRGIKGDFMALEIADETYDAAYEIEATCHAPDKVGVFKEIHRVLKPGGLFAGYEWCMTEAYDAEDAEHRRIKHEIETGDGLPDIASEGDVVAALEAAGFEVVEARDVAGTSDAATPWYLPLQGEPRSGTALRRSRVGRYVGNRALALLETLRIAPKGSTEVSNMLNLAADALIEGGKRGIFTPDFFFLARRVA